MIVEILCTTCTISMDLEEATPALDRFTTTCKDSRSTIWCTLSNNLKEDIETIWQLFSVIFDSLMIFTTYYLIQIFLFIWILNFLYYETEPF